MSHFDLQKLVKDISHHGILKEWLQLMISSGQILRYLRWSVALIVMEVERYVFFFSRAKLILESSSEKVWFLPAAIYWSSYTGQNWQFLLLLAICFFKGKKDRCHLNIATHGWMIRIGMRCVHYSTRLLRLIFLYYCLVHELHGQLTITLF